MTSSAAYSAFISYASENSEKAEEICASLERRGLVCWMAPRDIRAGREYADEIIHGLERSAAVVLVLSEAANTSVFVLREIERAVSKDINVVPVRIEEVTPSPGLELFISGTHWMDVWRGDWDKHMDRLVRDLSDSPVGPAKVEASAGHRSVEQHRSLRMVYVAAGLVLAAALSGVAIWSFSRDTQPPAERVIRPEPEPATDIVQNPTPIVQNPPPVVPNQTPTIVPDKVEEAPEPPPRAVEASGALNALRDDYDDLALRGGVIDDALNQLWEEMKPNSPRLDMVTHQRRLRTNLTRSKDALADRDAAGARRYLEGARTDLAVLEEFLNR
jgi:TIR domain-containing protein